MATTKVTDQSFQEDVIDSSKAVLVDFWAEWCGPCKAIGPSLEEIADEMAETVTVAKLNIDENPDIASKLGVRGIPTMMLFKDGEVASVKVGALPKSQIVDWINSSISSSGSTLRSS